MPPVGKIGNIIPEPFLFRVKDVGAVFVNKEAVFVVIVVGISSNMLPFFHNQNLPVELACYAFGDGCPCKT